MKFLGWIGINVEVWFKSMEMKVLIKQPTERIALPMIPTS